MSMDFDQLQWVKKSTNPVAISFAETANSNQRNISSMFLPSNCASPPGALSDSDRRLQEFNRAENKIQFVPIFVDPVCDQQ